MSVGSALTTITRVAGRVRASMPSTSSPDSSGKLKSTTAASDDLGIGLRLEQDLASALSHRWIIVDEQHTHCQPWAASAGRDNE